MFVLIDWSTRLFYKICDFGEEIFSTVPVVGGFNRTFPVQKYDFGILQNLTSIISHIS